MATVTGAIAAKGGNTVIISTYSKDYFMVRDEQLKLTREALIETGFKELVS